jgi:hypothetical protein
MYTFIIRLIPKTSRIFKIVVQSWFSRPEEEAPLRRRLRRPGPKPEDVNYSKTKKAETRSRLHDSPKTFSVEQKFHKMRSSGKLSL